jgi:hypothetical protein
MDVKWWYPFPVYICVCESVFGGGGEVYFLRGCIEWISLTFWTHEHLHGETHSNTASLYGQKRIYLVHSPQRRHNLDAGNSGLKQRVPKFVWVTPTFCRQEL